MIRYIVNEEKKTVVAILESVNKYGEVMTEIDAFRKLRKILGHSNASAYTHPYLMMESRYVAKATCHGDDEFDVAKGKKIAKRKVKDKYYKALDRRLLRYSEDLQKEAGLIKERVSKDQGDRCYCEDNF